LRLDRAGHHDQPALRIGEATEVIVDGVPYRATRATIEGRRAMHTNRATGPSRAAERRLRRESTAHMYARERGVLASLYVLVRLLTVVVLRGWFRVRIVGTDQIPDTGAAIVAPNHKNFLDAFFVGLATRRHVRFMAKVELFKGPLWWLLLRLGAFPVRRGEADTEAVETARVILAGGGLVVVFPEGTRVERVDALGSPHHGAGRLALETGAPIIPAAITGTSHLWRGALPKLRRVQLTFLAPVLPDQAADGEDPVSGLIDDRVWPAVREEYGRLRASPGMIVTALAAIGVGGGLVARRQLDARRKPTLLGKVAPRKQRRHRTLRRLIGRIRPRR
jgi:1-acyl-sn-glycerol-3-phosphate acyltransferase